MKIALALLLLMSSVSFAELKCPKGSFDWRGTCTADIKPAKAPASSMVQPSDEKPRRGQIPEWQAGEVKAVDAPNLFHEDREWDKAKAKADREGKRRAGIE